MPISSLNSTNKNVSGSFINASGGLETTITIGSSNYRVHTYYSTSSFIVSQLRESPNNTIEYLCIAGGGGGGSPFNATSGGGGGAGGMRSGSFTPTLGTYIMTVGSGGAPGAPGSRGSNGQNSVIDLANITSLGGGGGGSSYGLS